MSNAVYAGQRFPAGRGMTGPETTAKAARARADLAARACFAAVGVDRAFEGPTITHREALLLVASSRDACFAWPHATLRVAFLRYSDEVGRTRIGTRPD